MDQIAIGTRIKAARERVHLTQEQLAEIVDISPTHMSVIERCVKTPKLDTFVRIANALGVSTDALLQDVNVLQQCICGNAQSIGDADEGVQLGSLHTPFNDTHVGRTDIHDFCQLFLRQMNPFPGGFDSGSNCNLIHVNPSFWNEFSFCS